MDPVLSMATPTCLKTGYDGVPNFFLCSMLSKWNFFRIAQMLRKFGWALVWGLYFNGSTKLVHWWQLANVEKNTLVMKLMCLAQRVYYLKFYGKVRACLGLVYHSKRWTWWAFEIIRIKIFPIFLTSWFYCRLRLFLSN